MSILSIMCLLSWGWLKMLLN